MYSLFSLTLKLDFFFCYQTLLLEPYFYSIPVKGQLILKGLFGVFNFLQKTNKRIILYYYETSGRFVFVHFLEEIEDTKKTFRT